MIVSLEGELGDSVTTLSSRSRLGSGVDLLERSVKDEVSRLRARLVWYKVYCVQCLGDN